MQTKYLRIPVVLLIILLLTSTIGFNSVQAQVPDTVEFEEVTGEVELFDGRIIFGRIIGKYYFKGEDIDQLKMNAIGQDKSPREFVFNEERNHYWISFSDKSYNDLPIIDITYEGNSYRFVTEMYYTDWPGNEINWRIVPRVHITKAEQ